MVAKLLSFAERQPYPAGWDDDDRRPVASATENILHRLSGKSLCALDSEMGDLTGRDPLSVRFMRIQTRTLRCALRGNRSAASRGALLQAEIMRRAVLERELEREIARLEAIEARDAAEAALQVLLERRAA